MGPGSWTLTFESGRVLVEGEENVKTRTRLWIAAIAGLSLVACGSPEGLPAGGPHGGSGAEAMDPATRAANAISEGMNGLYTILEWNDQGASGTPPVDAATLTGTMAALDEGIDEILHGGRIWSGGPPLTDADLARVRRLAALLPGWSSKGPLPAEAVTLAEDIFRVLAGGKSWRELAAAAREQQGKPAPASP